MAHRSDSHRNVRETPPVLGPLHRGSVTWAAPLLFCGWIDLEQRLQPNDHVAIREAIERDEV